MFLRSGHHERRGFTVVELLVVVGVIAVLLSILLPALAKARAQSLLLNCQTRMRAQLQAHRVYSTDYHSLKPPLAATSGTTTIGYWMATMVRWSDQPLGAGILIANGYMPLDAVLDDRDWLQEDAENDRWMWSHSSTSGSSYFYFWRMPTDTGETTYERCWGGGNKVIILETNMDNDAAFYGIMPPGGWNPHPIINRTNVGYGDGSVRSFPADEVKMRASSGSNLSARMLDFYSQANSRY